ncbi:MAG: hypothetical protein ABJF23_17470 [Bryobacteraceae bacterium]
MGLSNLAAPLLLCLPFLVSAANKPEVDEDKFIAWVQGRVQQAQPTKAERKFDQVGWAKGIVDAERLAKLHNRPVFLFTHDGRVNWGRC